MKVGVRRRSFKKSISAKTTGKYKRKLKRMVNPFYGKKGIGWIKNPKRAIYNKIYRKTTISSRKANSIIENIILVPFIFVTCFFVFALYLLLIAMYYVIKFFVCLFLLIVNGIISLIEIAMNRTCQDEPEVIESMEEIQENEIR